MTQPVDWPALAPALCVAVAAVLSLVADLALPRLSRVLPCAVGVAGCAVALAFVAADHQRRQVFCVPSRISDAAPDCSWQVDDFTVAWWVLIAASALLICLLAQPSIGTGELPAGELYFLLLTSAAGAMALAASRDLITLVVSMETVTLPTFVLVGLRNADRRGSEAALKFFLVSVVSTAITLLGISLVYGGSGSVMAGSVSAMGAGGRSIIEVGLALTIVGLAFKVAAVPFHMWVPDTYVGAPIPVAAYLSVVSKAAGLAGIAIVLVGFGPAMADTWRVFVAVAAAVTMTVGNLAALRQRHLVRLLAWSSVAQAGYLLVPIAAVGRSNSGDDLAALQAYALMYALVNLGAFAVVVAVAAAGAVDVDDVAGLVRRQPLLGLALVFALLCLAGLPPGVVGLLAKVVVFQSAVDGHLTWLAVVMAVNVAIGLVYYLRVVVVAVGPSSADPAVSARPRTAAPVAAVVAVTLAASVVLSVVPGPLFSVFP
jgi:NADH-quinone oxidoreductase subunit N